MWQIVRAAGVVRLAALSMPAPAAARVCLDVSRQAICALTLGLRSYVTAAAVLDHLVPARDLKELTDKVYSLAVNNTRDPKIVTPLLDAAVEDAHDLTRTQLAQLTHSMALLGIVHAPLVKRARDVCLTDAGKLSPQDMAVFAWSLAHLGAYDRSVFSALARAGVYTLGKMNLQASTRMVSAYAKVGDFDRALFRAVAKRTLKFANQYRPKDLVELAEGLAVAPRIYTGRVVFRAIADSVRARVQDFTVADLRRLFAVLRVKGQLNEDFKGDVRDSFRARWQQLSPDEQTQTGALFKTFNIPHFVF